MLAALALCLAWPQSYPDSGVLLGLRDAKGAYRSLLVAKKGVAYQVIEHKGELLRPLKLSVHSFSVKGNSLDHSGQVTDMGRTFRIACLAVVGIGIEFDESRPGEAPFTRVSRRTGLAGADADLNKQLTSYEREAFQTAADRARQGVRLDLPNAPDPLDWGFVRNEGRWQFVAAFVGTYTRLEFTMDDPPVMNPPLDNGEVSWRSVVSAHPDAIDAVSSRDYGYAVVLTKDYLYVHEASRTSLGREVRRIPARDERVVGFSWNSSGPLAAIVAHMKG